MPVRVVSKVQVVPPFFVKNSFTFVIGLTVSKMLHVTVSGSPDISAVPPPLGDVNFATSIAKVASELSAPNLLLDASYAFIFIRHFFLLPGGVGTVQSKLGPGTKPLWRGVHVVPLSVERDSLNWEASAAAVQEMV